MRRVSLDTLAVTTIAGGTTIGWADGVGSVARFSSPLNILALSPGVVVLSDFGNARIRALFANACPVGSYRADGQRLCTACGRGRFPVNASDPGSCVACVAAGACGAGMQESDCPVDAALVRCEPCAPLPVGALWVGSGCEYRCPAGTYHAGGACVACTVTACPPGSVLAACTSFEDGNCDQACTNATMPAQNAVWTDGCGWSCAVGFAPSLQDYWMFQYYVCWPV